MHEASSPDDPNYNNNPNNNIYWWKLARELANTCLQEHSNADGDLASGGLGSWAYLQYELSKHCEDASQQLLFLQSARDACLESLKRSTPTETMHATPSILTNSNLGARALLTVIYNQLSQPYDGRDHLRVLLDALEKNSEDSDNCTLWNGQAGALQGIFFLRRELASPKGASELAIRIAIKAIKLADKTEKGGMKHGKLGMLYTLLGLEEDEWKAVEAEIPGAKEQLKTIVDKHCISSNESLDASWDTGVAGQILVLLRASQVYGNQEYYQHAKHLTKDVLLPGCDKTKLGLSKGIVGVAYTLRYMGQDVVAEKLVNFAIHNWKDLTSDYYGLFDGLGGLVLLLIDMADSKTISFPFLHPPLSSDDEEALFGESDFLANDNFNFRGNPSSRQKQDAMEGRLCEIQDSIFPFFATEQKLSTDEAYSSNNASDSRQTDNKEARATDGNDRTHAPERTTPIASPNKSFNYASPTTSSYRRKASKYTPERKMTASSTQSSISKWMLPSPLRKPVSIRNSPVSPPRPKRLNIDKSAIAKYQRRDLNGRLARRTMDKCLQNTDSGGSLLTGGLGVRVFLRLKMSQTHPQEKTNTLKAALIEAEAALEMTKNRTETFRASIFTGEYVGAKSLYAATLYQLNRMDEAFDHALELLEKLEDACAKLPAEECDVMNGRAGALKTIWFLRQELNDPSFGRDFVLRTSQQILIQGMVTARKRNSESLLMWEWRGKAYLGAAHGVVGIIHSLLGHSEEEWGLLDKMLPRVKDVVLQAIESLKGCCHVSGNLRKKLDGDEEDELVSLAHGSPGYCLVLTKAAEVFPDVRVEFLKIAREMAETLLQPARVNSVQVGLMRGISGNAYVFLSLARLDVQYRSKWISQAEKVAHSATNDLDSLISHSRRPYSLFEGIGGLTSLLLDLMDPEASYLPLLEAKHIVTKKCDVAHGDASTASTTTSTRCNTPFKSPGKRAPMSPLTDPHITPAKDRISVP